MRATSSSARWVGPGLAVGSLVVGLVALEVVAAIWAERRREDSARRPDGPLLIVKDAELGWRAAPHRDLPAGEEGGRFTTDERGWRRYDAGGERPLLLVLGDSYTHAARVPDGAVYYDHVARELGCGVAALAVEGYGTLQELMVARREAARLPAPAALLLQMSDNDAINNSLVLERRSWLNNNLAPRPYIDRAGRIALGDPRRLHERLTIGRELTRRLLAGRLPTIEEGIEAGRPRALRLYSPELSATTRSLRRLRRLFPSVPAFAFNVGGSETRIGRDLERLARQEGFSWIDLPPAFGRRTRPDLLQADHAHWNEPAHALAAEALTPPLREALSAPQLAPAGENHSTAGGSIPAAPTTQ